MEKLRLISAGRDGDTIRYILVGRLNGKAKGEIATFVNRKVRDTENKEDTLNLVPVCAWCPKKTYPQLKNGQSYTHGICPEHKKDILNKKRTMLKETTHDLISSIIKL